MSNPTLRYATPTSQHDPGRQVFGVVVRTIGVLVVLYGVRAFLLPVYAALGFPYSTGEDLPPENHVVEGSVASVVGLLLIRGGWLVRLAYGRND